MTNIEPPFAIWQGFRHSWTYNHRLNRLGDWLTCTAREGDMLAVEVAHSAASGTGRDEATFSSFRTAARAGGVQYHEVHEIIQISSREQESRSFVRDVRVSVPSGYDRFAAILTGFDLCSAKDADKLVSFHLATTEPRRDTGTGEVVFQIIGALNVDCDSPECDLYDSTGAMIAAVVAGAAAGANYGPLGAVAGGVFGALFSKLDITTDYELSVRCALITGSTDSLHATRHSARHVYAWGTERAVTRANDGTVRGFKMVGNDDQHWCASVPAIDQLSLEVTRDRGLLRPDTAMHLLEWDMAVRPVSSDGAGCIADLEMFFRNWRNEPSRYLDDQISTFEGIEPLDELSENIASHRDAGVASIVMGLSLLQFATASIAGPEEWEARLVWPGQGANAKSEDAIRRHTVDPYEIEPPVICGPPPWATAVVRIAADHST
jgi:hypothetical protein